MANLVKIMQYLIFITFLVLNLEYGIRLNDENLKIALNRP